VRHDVQLHGWGRTAGCCAAYTSLFLFIATLVPSYTMCRQVGSTKPSMLRQKLLSVVSADFALLLDQRDCFEYVCKGTKFD
jgi:hypothetical protein